MSTATSPLELTHSDDYTSFCNQTLQDPYPLFDELRQKDPIHWCEALGCWLAFGFDDTFAGLNNSRLLGGRRDMYDRMLSEENRREANPLVEHLNLWLQTQNPPRHTRLRRLASIAFTPRLIRDLIPRFRQIAQDRLDVVRDKVECDFVKEFCYWVPATVICDMLGLPQSDHDQTRAWVEDFIPFSSAAGPSLNNSIDRALKGLKGLRSYFERIIAQRRDHPEEDLLSELVMAEIDGDRLSDEELFALCVFLFVAGHETTMSLLGSGTMLLLSHPEQLALFKSNPKSLVDSAIEEFVRYESPVTRAIRVASEDVSIHGRTIRKGQTITFLLGAANRDPAHFPDPHRLDIQRQPNKHLGFGWGRHFCIGAELARLEAQIAFPMIFEQMPNLRLVSQSYAWRAAFGIRSLQSLPITTQ